VGGGHTGCKRQEIVVCWKKPKMQSKKWFSQRGRKGFTELIEGAIEDSITLPGEKFLQGDGHTQTRKNGARR